jgi:seryl-tRNA synthetase
MKITLTELRKILKHDAQRRALKRRVRELEGERDALKAQILEMVAGDAVLLEKAKVLFGKSEKTEAKMEAGVPAK